MSRRKSKLVTSRGLIFNVQRFSLQDGPGIRTTVFFKGCPLRCDWCSNPESQVFSPEVAHRDSLCNGCGHCVNICEVEAISVNDKRIIIDRRKCTNCGKCVEVCDTGALQLLGKEMSASEVVQEVTADGAYYRNSGGGMTASGGEPLSQPVFVKELFNQCHRKGITTVLDTTGYGKPDILREVIQDVDIVLYDLKHMDSGIHKKFTGVTNELILHNVKVVAETGVEIIFRIALIPGVNDSEGNIRNTAEFVLSFGGKQLDILPYHRLGIGKYATLDQPFKLQGLEPPKMETVENLKQIIQGFGLKCNIGG